MSFEVAALDDLVDADPFDLVFGRYVLMHQDEPAGMLRQASRLLRPGGVLAFHEVVVLDGFLTSPDMPTWERMNDYLVGSANTGLQCPDVAHGLVAYFSSAGLGVPRLFAESLVGEAATSAITTWFAETIRTVLPKILARGVDQAEISIDTLADRLRAEARAVDGQVLSPRQVGAWLRT